MEKKTVLVVDDDKAFLSLVERDLTMSGYLVIKAEDGKVALEIVKSGVLPDLILLDVHMPEIDGGEVAQILKVNPKTKEIPVIYLTSLLTKEEEKSRNNIKGNFFIAKPYDAKKLLSEIKSRI